MRSAPERPLRVLITNRILTTRTGTELYVRDLAAALLARGHQPVVYSTQLGAVAREIRAATVPVVDDLAAVGAAPDVIHGHHNVETMAALLAFPGVPAVAFCHSWIGRHDVPARFPRIRRWVAVDHTCRDRLLLEHGIPEERLHVVLNWVDLERFPPRPPLPPRPRRALVFSNAAREDVPWVRAVRRACDEAGIALELAGSMSGASLADPGRALGGYDLVFAKARAALEAMAVGAAVILCDFAGAGPLVTAADFPRLRPLNFGVRALREPATPEGIAREIARYDAADAAEVSRRVREGAGRDATVDELLALYHEVIDEHRAAPAPDPAEESRAAAAFLQWLAPRLAERDLLHIALDRLLRLPVVGRALRARARAQSPERALPQLLRILDSW